MAGEGTSRDAGRTARGAIVGGALAAIAAGLGGVEYGLFLVVAGVWTVRWAWGAAPGAVWGLALLAAGFRWDTLSFAQLAAAVRLTGPGMVTTPVLAAAGVGLAALGAFVDEAALNGLRGRSHPERLAAGAAVVSLAAAVGVPALGTPAGALWLGLLSAATSAVMLASTRVAQRIPRWIAPAVCVAGTVAVGLA